MSDQPDIQQPNPVLPIKTVSKIGDGKGLRFAVEHPAAPYVVCHLYRAVGGQEVLNLPAVDNGRVVYVFAQPPGVDEFLAVVIG